MRIESAGKRRDEGVVADGSHREGTLRIKSARKRRDERERTRGSGREGVDKGERMEAAERGQDEGAVMDY